MTNCEVLGDLHRGLKHPENTKDYQAHGSEILANVYSLLDGNAVRSALSITYSSDRVVSAMATICT